MIPDISFKLIVNRLLGLLRGRYLMSIFGIIMMHLNPGAAQWILGAVAIACGVSAVDAWKGNNSSTNNVSIINENKDISGG
jgi:hypothetical protein